MSNTPVTMNERRLRTLLACVRFTNRFEEMFPGMLTPNDDLLPAEQMLLAALARIRDNEERILRKRWVELDRR